MAVPTVNVTVTMHNPDGSPSVGAKVFAKLSTIERYQGYVVPREYVGETDAAGTCVLAMFPNELGSESSEYKFKIIDAQGKTLTVYAVIPNADCSLHQVTELDPYERVGAGVVITSEVSSLVADAEAHRTAAEASELNAKASEDNAKLSEDAAALSASAAAGSEDNAKLSEDAAALSEQNAKDSEEAAAQSAETAFAAAGGGVLTFNGRNGLVMPGSGDYTAGMVGAIPSTEKAAPNGVAPLGADSKVPAENLPSLDYVPTTEKGAPNGVASLGADGLVPMSQIPAPAKSGRVVADITERDSIPVSDLYESMHCLVTDATGDPTVASGAAEYVWNGSAWVKVSESESLDVTVSVENVVGLLDQINDLKTKLGKADLSVLACDQFNKLVSGEALGTEGKMRTKAFSITINFNSYASYAGTVSTYLADTSVTGSNDIGSTSSIECGVTGCIVGNDGTPYSIYWARLNSDKTQIREFCLSPEHGDVRTNFTNGNTYGVTISYESQDAEDQMTGDVDVSYVLMGSQTTKDDYLSAFSGDSPDAEGAYFGEILPGWWNGNEWKSNLLTDMTSPGGGALAAILPRKLVRPFWTLEVMKKDGSWKEYGWRTDPEAVKGGAYTFSTSDGQGVGSPWNQVWFNVSQSYVGLGYASQPEMLASAKVRIRFKTLARRLRPINNPTGLAIKPFEVLYSNDHSVEAGAQLGWELTGRLQWGAATNSIVHAAATGLFYLPKTRSIASNGIGVKHTVYSLNYSSCPQGCKVAYAPYQGANGNWHLALWFDGLVHNGVDWGDSGGIDVSSNVTTRLDPNGGVVRHGVMGFDTGMAA